MIQKQLSKIRSVEQVGSGANEAEIFRCELLNFVPLHNLLTILS